MSTQTQYIVQKLWNYCDILRDDGMSYGDYVEQLTYLLFLKMAHERTQTHDELSRIPEGLGWETLITKDADDLETHYRHILEQLSTQKGMLGIIFRKAINKIQNPAHLRRLVTMLRLPTGIFYAQGVKANVLFFDKLQGSPRAQTERLWIYDLRTNINFTLRTNPLRREHLDDFVACFHPENRHKREESERFHSFSYEDLLKRDKLSLDLFWLRDESLEGTDKLPPPAEIAASIVEDLQNALEQFMAIAEDLGGKSTRTSGPLQL
jgi:type I restriction-modification system DNA methylase subunit